MINLGNDYLYKFLGDLGYTGNLNDRWYDYLRDQGLTGTVNDMLYKLLVAFGFTGSVDDMWNKYIDSNNGIFTGFEKLRLDFTRGTLDSRITFSRTSNATITKSDGTIGYAPHNLLTYSEQFDNAAWAKQRAAITANTILAPNGTFTADVLTEDSTATETHQIARSITTDATAYTYSIYVKANTRNWIALWANTAGAYFNISAGTIGTVSSGVTANITNEGDGWYRCSVTRTMTAASSSFIVYMATANNTVIYTGNGTSNIYIWGAQLEIGSTATTYNPTTVKNLLGYSELFDNAAWTKSNSFVQTNLLYYSEAYTTTSGGWSYLGGLIAAINQGAAPNGYQTAGTMTASSGSNQGLIAKSSGITSGITYTLSIYAKANTGNFIQLTFSTPFDGTNIWANFDLVNGTVGSIGSSVVTTSITPVGNGWYRCTLTGVATGSIALGQNTAVYGVVNSASATRLGAATIGESIYIWGAQLVQGSTAGDYRRTDAAALPVFYPNHNGVVCAEKLVETTAASAAHYISVNYAFTSGVYTASIYAKAGERGWLRMFGGASFNGAFANFDLVNGVIGTTGNTTSQSIISVGNGWYRCSITAPATGTALVGYQMAQSNTIFSYTGDGTSGIYIFGAQLSDSASLDPYVLNAAAAPSAQAYYGARFDYDPVTLAPKGLLIEEARTNLLLNSTIDGANLATQNVTVTAVAHTISFYGTGTITLSGTATATINGTGAYPTRTTLTFTPTAGTLTVTVSGTVQYAQLTTGSVATSFIPTAGATVTRAADFAVIQGSNFYSWYNQNEGTMYANYDWLGASSFDTIFAVGTDANNNTFLGLNSSNVMRLVNSYVGTTDVNAIVAPAGGITANTFYRLIGAYKINDFATTANSAVTVNTDTVGTTPISNQARLGQNVDGTNGLNGHIKQISYYNTRLPNATLQGLTA